MSNARSQYLPSKLLAALPATLGLANAARAQDDGAPTTHAFSGFGTLGVVHSSENQADYTNSPWYKPSGAGYSRDWSPAVDSRLGLQLDAKFSPRWSAVVPIDQMEGSALRDEFYAKFAGKSAGQIKIPWSKIIFTGRGPRPTALPDSMAVRSRVAEDPHAIGYIDQSQVDDRVRVLLSP